MTRSSSADDPSPPLDPSAWGEDHVGKQIPDYVTGDECLFCHRNDIGPNWSTDHHARTIRFADKEKDKPPLAELETIPELKPLLEQAVYVIGRQNMQRLLKDSSQYGHFEITDLKMIPKTGKHDGKLENRDHPGWNSEQFATKCAGCHATAVETETHAFAAFSLDCYSCHGSVSLQHTSDTKVILLSKKRDDPAQVVASICGQCHLRGGKSKSSGLVYPNQFVAGDNLFKDFEVNFAEDFISKMNPGDRHIYRNIKDIVVGGETRLSCVNCHEVHTGSSQMHLGVRNTAYCLECHLQEGPKRKVVEYESHSETCGY